MITIISNKAMITIISNTVMITITSNKAMHIYVSAFMTNTAITDITVVKQKIHPCCIVVKVTYDVSVHFNHFRCRSISRSTRVVATFLISQNSQIIHLISFGHYIYLNNIKKGNFIYFKMLISEN